MDVVRADADDGVWLKAVLIVGVLEAVLLLRIVDKVRTFQSGRSSVQVAFRVIDIRELLASTSPWIPR